MAKNKEKGDFMDLQERYDNLSTGKKVLLYVVALLMLILSAAISFNGMAIFGIIIFLLDLIYFFIILFFSFKHINFNKTTINAILNTIKKVSMLIIAVIFIIMIIAIILDNIGLNI